MALCTQEVKDRKEQATGVLGSASPPHSHCLCHKGVALAGSDACVQALGRAAAPAPAHRPRPPAVCTSRGRDLTRGLLQSRCFERAPPTPPRGDGHIRKGQLISLLAQSSVVPSREQALDDLATAALLPSSPSGRGRNPRRGKPQTHHGCTPKGARPNTRYPPPSHSGHGKQEQ